MRARVWIGLVGGLTMAASCAQSPSAANVGTSANMPNLEVVQQANPDAEETPLEDRDLDQGTGEIRRANRPSAPPRRPSPAPSGDGGRRVRPPDRGGVAPGGDGGRVRPPRRSERPSWWGRRTWLGRGVRPSWWDATPVVANSYILVEGYYYPYVLYQGYYYPDFSSPYIFENGRYLPYYETQQPSVPSGEPIPVGSSAEIVTVSPAQRGEPD